MFCFSVIYLNNYMTISYYLYHVVNWATPIKIVQNFVKELI